MNTCRHCRKKFQPQTSGGRYRGWYCSRECSHRARTLRREVPCSVCGKAILRKKYHLEMSGRRGHFCGHACYAKWQSRNMRGSQNPSWKKRVPIECHSCSRVFLVRPSESHRLFCSRGCFFAAHTKDYPRSDSFYNSLWARQRLLALKRDGCRCVYCHAATRLLVHHRRPLRDFLAEAVRLAHGLDNLETTCEVCHGRQHSRLLKSRGPKRS